jgi:hypothetical protein
MVGFDAAGGRGPAQITIASRQQLAEGPRAIGSCLTWLRNMSAAPYTAPKPSTRFCIVLFGVVWCTCVLLPGEIGYS